MLVKLLVAFFTSSVLLISLYLLSFKLGLVDCPNAERKHHKGNIPVIGGVAVYSAIAVVLLLFPGLLKNDSIYLCCSAVLVLVGLIDDKFDISVLPRLIILIGLATWLSYVAEIRIFHLGNLMGNGVLVLDHSSVLFTIFAIIGAVTAFNMVDGLDGLLGGLSSVTLIGLSILFAISGRVNLMLFCLVFIVAMLPYVLSNLALLPNKNIKIFMGDSGSLFIGFSIIWLLIAASQSSSIGQVHPVTALWLIAFPLMDMASTMIRRIRKKQSPFKADRRHLHHIFLRLGFSPAQTLLSLCSFAMIMMVIGLIGEICNISEVIMFMLFLFIFSLYYYCVTRIWKITVFLRKKLFLFNR